jgi:hypothetical protein
VEAAETAKTAKIRRLKMRLKRPAASILITTPLLHVWGQSAEVWLLFFLSSIYFYSFTNP